MNVDLALELSKLVHNECKEVPHDIGIRLIRIVEKHQEAINFTDSCEKLNHEDLTIGEKVRITQTKLVEINCFREDGDIDVEDITSVFVVGINEISKVV